MEQGSSLFSLAWCEARGSAWGWNGWCVLEGWGKMLHCS